MAIRINGTTISTNRLNSSNITLERLNGATVYTSTQQSNRKWVMAYTMSSQPDVDLGIIELSSGSSGWLSEITTQWPPNNYAVGTTGCVWDGDTTYYVYQVQIG